MGMWKRKWRSGMMMGIGAAAGYFWDPQNGRRRRAMMSDKLRATQHRLTARAEMKARYAEGVAAGVEARMEGKGQFHPDGDRSIADHLHQVVRSLPFNTSLVEIDVAEGIVGLRGQLRTPEEIRQVKSAVSASPGVVAVNSWLHLPGTMAPNKADALVASGRSVRH